MSVELLLSPWLSLLLSLLLSARRSSMYFWKPQPQTPSLKMATSRVFLFAFLFDLQ